MGAIDAHLRKLLPSSFVCLVQHQAGKALSLETGLTIILRPTKYKTHTFFIGNIHIFVIFGFKSIIFVLDWVVRTLSFKLTDIIILC